MQGDGFFQKEGKNSIKNNSKRQQNNSKYNSFEKESCSKFTNYISKQRKSKLLKLLNDSTPNMKHGISKSMEDLKFLPLILETFENLKISYCKKYSIMKRAFSLASYLYKTSDNIETFMDLICADKKYAYAFILNVLSQPRLLSWPLVMEKFIKLLENVQEIDGICKSELSDAESEKFYPEPEHLYFRSINKRKLKKIVGKIRSDTCLKKIISTDDIKKYKHKEPWKLTAPQDVMEKRKGRIKDLKKYTKVEEFKTMEEAWISWLVVPAHIVENWVHGDVSDDEENLESLFKEKTETSTEKLKEDVSTATGKRKVHKMKNAITRDFFRRLLTRDVEDEITEINDISAPCVPVKLKNLKRTINRYDMTLNIPVSRHLNKKPIDIEEKLENILQNWRPYLKSSLTSIPVINKMKYFERSFKVSNLDTEKEKLETSTALQTSSSEEQDGKLTDKTNIENLKHENNEKQENNMNISQSNSETKSEKRVMMRSSIWQNESMRKHRSKKELAFENHKKQERNWKNPGRKRRKQINPDDKISRWSRS